MIRKNTYLIGIYFVCLMVITGCISETKAKPQVNKQEPVNYKQDMLTQALEHAQQMQAAAIQAQDENAVLRARNAELMEQIKALQGGEKITEETEPVFQLPEDATELEKKYIELQKENEELRKLVKHEMELREDLLRKVEQDRITINELKNKLGE